MPPYPCTIGPGFIVGVNGGYGWGQQDPFNIITNRFDNRSIDLNGGVFGGTVGAQIQSGHVVLGLEADLDWANIKGSSTAIPTIGGIPIPGAAINASTKISWESTVRTRVGYADQNWLWYATGGLALLGAETNLTTVGGAAVCGGIFTGCSPTNRQFGAALGGGLEYGFSPNLSAKIEYLYIAAASLSVSNHSEIRGGLNYRFGGN